MTDEQKELITSAAKSLGYEYVQPVYDDDCCKIITHEVMKNGVFTDFNPLTTPSDLMELIVGLEIDGEWDDENYRAYKWIGKDCIWYIEPYAEGKHQSLALAVLRVAAEIGRKL